MNHIFISQVRQADCNERCRTAEDYYLSLANRQPSFLTVKTEPRLIATVINNSGDLSFHKKYADGVQHLI